MLDDLINEIAETDGVEESIIKLVGGLAHMVDTPLARMLRANAEAIAVAIVHRPLPSVIYLGNSPSVAEPETRRVESVE